MGTNFKRFLSMLLILSILVTMPAFNVLASGTGEPMEPTVLQKVSRTASVSTGQASDITITTANIFELGNNYGQTKVLFEVSGLDFAGDKGYYAFVQMNGQEQYIYIRKVTDTLGSFSIYLDYIEEGKIDFNITVQDKTSQPTIIYSSVGIDTYIKSSFSMPFEDINNEKQYISNLNLYPYVSINVPVDYITENIVMKLVDNQGQVYAISSSNQNKPNFYETTIYDTRYNNIYSFIPGNELQSKVKMLYGSLECGKQLVEGQYDLEVYDNENNFLYKISGVAEVTNKPYVTISPYVHEYPRLEVNSTEIYGNIGIYSGKPDDYNLALYNSVGELVAKSNGIYRIKSYGTNYISAVYNLFLESGKSITAGNYTLKLITDVDCITDGDYSITLYENTSKNIYRAVVPNPKVANIVAYGKGYDSNKQYKAVLQIDENIIDEELVSPVNNVFDIEFKDINGEVINLLNQTHYSIYIKDRDYNGEWEQYGANSSFYNYNYDDGEYEDPLVNNDYYGYSSFVNGKLLVTVWAKDSIGSNMVDTTKFKVVVTSVLGGEYTYSNFTVSKRVYEGKIGFDLEQNIFAGMPEGYYKTKVFYNELELKNTDGTNILDTNYNIQYNSSPRPGYGTSIVNNLRRIVNFWIYNIQNVTNPQLKLYTKDNITGIPNYTIDLVYENDRYVIKKDKATEVDFFKKYDGYIYVNGEFLGAAGLDEYYAPIDMEEDSTIYTITVSQTENGTLIPNVASGTIGTEVYIKNIPGNGYELKPGSVKVNGQAIVGRSFVLTENAVVTAEFQPVYIPKYTIEKGNNIYNGDISIDKMEAVQGEAVTITAKPNEGFKLKELKYRTKNVYIYTPVDLETMSFIMPDKNIIVEATFEYIQMYSAYAEYSPWGMVELENNYFEEGSIVNLTIKPDNGYRLKEGSLHYKIEGTDESIPILGTSFVMPPNYIRIYAEFEKAPTYMVKIVSTGNGYINLTPYSYYNEYAAGQEIGIEAVAYNGYRLVPGSLTYKVEGEEELISITDNKIIMPESNITIYAEFELIPPEAHLITIYPMQNGKVTADKETAVSGEWVTLIIIPEEGYKIIEGSLWANGILIPTNDRPIGFIMPNEDVTITGAFELIPILNKNIVTFDSNGGTVLNSIEVLYGELIIEPTPPVKEGSGFDGWYKDEGLIEKWNFAEDKVISDITLYAKWIENAYTVTFIGFTGEIIDVQNIAYGKNALVPEAPTIEGYTFIGWDKSYDSIIEDIEIRALYKANEYTVTFNSNGGTDIARLVSIYGSLITQPTPPTKDGSGFDGWYVDEGLTVKWNFEMDKVLSDMTLYAKWIENTYTVTFIGLNGEVIDTQSVAYGQSAFEPNKVREGYIITGWDKAFNNITENTVITAIYEVNKYTVRFDVNDGTEVDSISEVLHGSLIPAPESPTRTGYSFVGWYKDQGLSENWDFGTDKVKSDTVLYAKWAVNTYTVTFIGLNEQVINTQNITYGASAIAPEVPTIEGYTFIGWDKPLDNITGDTTIKAVYEVKKYTVSFESNGGTDVDSIIDANYDSIIIEPEEPMREGYDFEGWYKDQGLAQKWNFTTDKVTTNMTLFAKWIKKTYTVTFINWDNAIIKVQENVPHGTAAIAPKDPTREGYVFTGWDKTFDNITETITIKAIYKANKHSVYFHSMGGSSVAAILNVDHDSKILEPLAPTRDGYDLIGWYKDYGLTEPWNFEADVIKGNITLYAKWEAKSYRITINSNITGGQVTAKETAKAGELVTVAIIPEVSNTLKSLSWSATGAYASEINMNTKSFIMPARDIELNAKFNEMATLSVKVSRADSPYSISVYSSNPYFYDYRYIESGITETNLIVPKGVNYSVYVNMGENENWYWGNQEINVSEDATIDFNIPVTYSVSGKVNCTNGTLNDIYVYVSSGDSYGSVYINTDGTYTIKGLTPGAYTISIDNWNNKYSGDLSKNFTISDENVENVDFELTKGADLRVNLSKISGTPAFKAYTNLYKKNNGNWNLINSVSSSGTGTVAFDGAISSEGEYKLELSYLQEKNYTNPRFVSEPVEFTVTAEDINNGTISKDLTYSDPTDAAVALTGDGNLVVTNVKNAQKGNFVNLEIRYKNNGNIAINPQFTIILPEGLTLTGASTFNSTLEPNNSGSYKAFVNVNDVINDIAKIEVKVTLDEKTYDFGSADITITKVTLNAPMAVKTNENFKVYGEATEGSTVKIKNANTGQVFKTVTPQGKFYVAEIMLPEGETKLVAEAIIGGTVAQSKAIDIMAKSTPITIKKVTKDSRDLSFNSRLGIYVFSQYVDMSLMGYDFTLRTEFENASEISNVVYHFAGMDFVADNNFSVTFTGWGGAGLKPITATVTTVDGKILEFIIAEVTILIDPSGIVINEVTGESLEGVLMTCWILNEDTNVWEVWDAESYGQINPHYTDSQGKYGWMVPAGKYRVTATLDNFKDYDTMMDANFSNNNETTIIIPPPRDDVNFNMVPESFAINISEGIEGGVIVVKEIAQYTENVTVTVTAEEGKQLKVIKVDGQPINGTTFKMPAKNIVVTAEFEPVSDNPGGDNGGDNGGNTGDNNNGGGGIINPPTPTTPTTPKAPTPKDLELNVDTNGDVTISPDKLANAETLEIAGAANMVFDKKAIASMGITNDIVVSIKKINPSTLGLSNKKIIGDRPVFEFKVKSGAKTISKFDGDVTITIPYKAAKNEEAKYIRVYYIDEMGIAKRVPNSYYDKNTETIVFKTNHFSMFAVGYSEIDFEDAKGWAEEYIYYLADRGIISGKGKGMFVPNDSITRAEFVRILAGAADVDLSKYTTSKFSDVKNSDWFAKAVAWASEEGIVAGVGSNNFAPNANITREQMAVMLVRFAGKMGYQFADKDKLTVFADQANISDYAMDSVSTVQKAGIIVGKPNNLFDPKGKATRAEASKVIASLMQEMYK